MSDGRGSGVSPWLAGLVGFLAYRRGRRRGEQDVAGPGGRDRRRGGDDPRRGHWGGGSDGGPALREVRLPDGRDALQVEASLFLREEGDTGTWRRVAVEGTVATQPALELTLDEVAPGRRTATDVPVVLMPVSGRRGVVAVDAYATGGRIGNLPEYAVLAVGDALLTTHLALDRPCAVLGRIMPDPAGLLTVELMLPETFTPAEGEGGR